MWFPTLQNWVILFSLTSALLPPSPQRPSPPRLHHPLYPTDSIPDSLSVPPMVPYMPDRFNPRLLECPSSRPLYTRQIQPQTPWVSLQSSPLYTRQIECPSSRPPIYLTDSVPDSLSVPLVAPPLPIYPTDSAPDSLSVPPIVLPLCARRIQPYTP